MLRTNLATRPFYNERLVHVLLALIGLALVALTVFDIMRIVDLSRRHTALSLAAAADASASSEATRQAGTLRQQIDRNELARLASAAREANAIIDRRTFSWTELFNRIETTLPPDVRMTSVRPQIDAGQISVTMVVVSRRVEDIEKFVDNLEATGAFQELLARQEEATEERMYRATLTGRYVMPSTGPSSSLHPTASAGE